jgi:hypothetical protein
MKHSLQYWHGYLSGYWSQIRSRCNRQYVAGYIAGMLERWKS